MCYFSPSNAQRNENVHLVSLVIACVAGGISRASGEAVRGLVKSRDFTRGFAAREFPRGRSPRGNIVGRGAARPLTNPASYAG